MVKLKLIKHLAALSFLLGPALAFSNFNTYAAEYFSYVNYQSHVPNLAEENVISDTDENVISDTESEVPLSESEEALSSILKDSKYTSNIVIALAVVCLVGVMLLIVVASTRKQAEVKPLTPVQNTKDTKTSIKTPVTEVNANWYQRNKSAWRRLSLRDKISLFLIVIFTIPYIVMISAIVTNSVLADLKKISS
jgi:hypothetical protein